MTWHNLCIVLRFQICTKKKPKNKNPGENVTWANGKKQNTRFKWMQSTGSSEHWAANWGERERESGRQRKEDHRQNELTLEISTKMSFIISFHSDRVSLTFFLCTFRSTCISKLFHSKWNHFRVFFHLLRHIEQKMRWNTARDVREKDRDCSMDMNSMRVQNTSSSNSNNNAAAFDYDACARTKAILCHHDIYYTTTTYNFYWKTTNYQLWISCLLIHYKFKLATALGMGIRT